jgi:hypothetical protein
MQPVFSEPYLFNELFGYEYVCPEISTILVSDEGNKYTYQGDLEGKSAGFIYTFFNQHQFQKMTDLNKQDAS